MQTANKLILAFVTLIIGAVLIGSIATQGLAVTGKTSVVNEAIDITTARLTDAGSINTSKTFTVTNNPTSWKVNDCPLTTVVYGNSSDDYALTTDYTVDLSTGVITLVNSSAVVYGTNDTLVDYVYCGDDYMNLGWGRTLINLVSGFFAIAMLMISVGLFFSIAKDNGIF